MSHLFVFDFIWKFLFFSTVLSSSYFIIILFSSYVFRFYSAAKKAAALKTIAAFVVLSLVAVSLYLLISDHDIIADCFGQFAMKEGVFGITRILSAIWLLGTSLLLIKDGLLYKESIDQLRAATLKQKFFKMNGKSIKYFEVENEFEPVVAGLFKSQIFIPKSISENKLALQQILCHELIHIQNKDGLWSFLNIFIHRLSWHNPLAYFSVDKMKIQIEMATDELAVRTFDLKIAEYAHQLVGLIVGKKKDSLLIMNASGDFLQIQSRLLNLKNIQCGKVQSQSSFMGSVILIFLFGLSQASASIAQNSKMALEAQMCFQVNHELLIESWIMEKHKTETNKCE